MHRVAISENLWAGQNGFNAWNNLEQLERS